MPLKPAGDEQADINFSYVESMLYIFHQMADKAPGALNPVCGIKIITGQPQDFDMNDYPEKRKDLNDRLTFLDSESHRIQKIIQTNAAPAAGDTPQQRQEKKKTNEFRLLLITNIIRLTKSMLKTTPTFIKDIRLSWLKKSTDKPAATVASVTVTESKKRPATEQASGEPAKKKQRQVYVPPQRRDDAKDKDDSSNTKQQGNRGNRGGRGRKFRGMLFCFLTQIFRTW